MHNWLIVSEIWSNSNPSSLSSSNMSCHLSSLISNREVRSGMSHSLSSGVLYTVWHWSMLGFVCPGTTLMSVSSKILLKFPPVTDWTLFLVMLSRALTPFLLFSSIEPTNLTNLLKSICFRWQPPEIFSMIQQCVCTGSLNITLKLLFQLLHSCSTDFEPRFHVHEPVKWVVKLQQSMDIKVHI